jgi:hypothetical protein
MKSQRDFENKKAEQKLLKLRREFVELHDKTQAEFRRRYERGVQTLKEK